MSEHEQKANELAGWGDDSGKPTSMQLEALVHATLLVAEQQRIANLIAVAQYDETVMNGLIDGTLPKLMQTSNPNRKQIQDLHTRLGRSFLEISKALGIQG